MIYCYKCGKQLPDDAEFCISCGTALKDAKNVPAPNNVEARETQVLARPEPFVEAGETQGLAHLAPVFKAEPAPTVKAEPVPVFKSEPTTENREKLYHEEYEFLQDTMKILRWERKAWSIAGKVFLVLGIVYTALMGFASFLMLAAGDEGVFLSTFYGTYSILMGGFLIAAGIIGNNMAGKLNWYIDRVYSEFSYVNNRCGSVGMIVFCYFFNEIALVFFIINFVRMKANQKVIGRILENQRSGKTN